MTASYTVNDIQAVAPRVLARLRAMADLPAHGTVAGQAVASLVLEELGHGVRGQVRDIDVFVNCALPRAQRGLGELDESRKTGGPRRVNETVVQPGRATAEWDQYNRMKFIARRAGIRLLRTYRAGLVNYTLMDHDAIGHGSHGHEVDISRELVEGFDLNAVAVGVHLGSGELVASPSFLEFLNTGAVAVQCFNTPAHTLLRLANKVLGGQLPGSTCDFQGQREMLELAMLAQEGRTHTHFVLRFGERFRAMAELWAHVVPPVETELEQPPGAHGQDLPPVALHHFKPAWPTNPASQAMLRALDPSGEGALFLPQCVVRQALMADFSRVFALYHPSQSGLDEATAAAGRASLESMQAGDSDGANLLRYARAVGHPWHSEKLEGLDEDQVGAFFFGKQAARTEQGARQAREAWEAMIYVQHHVMVNLDLGADEALAIARDPAAGWKAILYRHGGQVLGLVAGERAGPVDQAEAFGRQLLDWAREEPRIWQRVVADLVPLAAGNGRGRLAVLAGILPEDQFQAVAREAMALALPQWPGCQGVERDVRIQAGVVWLSTRMDLPEAFWEGMADGDMAALTEAVCRHFPGRRKTVGELLEGDEGRTQVRERVLARALGRMDGDRAGAHQARVLRALVDAGETGLVVERARERVGDLAWTQALRTLEQALGRILRRKKGTMQEMLGMEDPGDDDGTDWDEDGWSHITICADDMANVRQVVLEHALAAPETPAPGARMRM